MALKPSLLCEVSQKVISEETPFYLFRRFPETMEYSTGLRVGFRSGSAILFVLLPSLFSFWVVGCVLSFFGTNRELATRHLKLFLVLLTLHLIITFPKV